MKKQGFTNKIKDHGKDAGSFNGRRRGADFLARVLAVLNLIAWVMVVLILVVAERAKPQFESFFDRSYHLDIRTFWDLKYVHYLLWITVAGVIISCVGLVVGVVRARRRKDPKNFGIMIMGLFSIVGFSIIVFFLY